MPEENEGKGKREEHETEYPWKTMHREERDYNEKKQQKTLKEKEEVNKKKNTKKCNQSVIF